MNEGGEIKIYCPICKWVVISLPALEDHMKRHRGLTEPVLYRCPHCPYSTDKAATLIGHQRSHADEKPYKCRVCEEVFANSGDFCSHQSVHIKRARRGKAFRPPPGDVSPDGRIRAGERPYHCNVCGVDFTQSHHLLNHERIHTGEKPYACAVCGKAFARAGTLVAHKRVHMGKKPYGARTGTMNEGGEIKIYCPICNWVVISLPALEDHMKRHRGLTEPVLYRCPHCPYSTDKAATLIGHQRSHADEKPYKCRVCDEVFANSGDFCSHQSVHMKRARRGKAFAPLLGDVSPDERIHAGVRPYHCNVCGMDFTQSHHLLNHQRIHTGEKPYACAVCGKAFARSGTLVTHKRVHTGKKPYKCATCGKAFKQSGALLNHERTHTGEKPYGCAACGKRFAQSRGLVIHSRTHTGERPYRCTMCGKSFAQSGALSVHRRTHTGERPYACPTCGKAFSESGTLGIHKRTHTGERPYTCDVCGSSFTHSGTLRAHKRTHAGGRPFTCPTRGKASSGVGSLRARRRARAGSNASTPPARPPLLCRRTRGRAGCHEGVTAAGEVVASHGGEGPAATPSATPMASLTSERGETLSFETWPGVKVECDGEDPSASLPIVKRERGGIASSETWPGVKVEHGGGEDSSVPLSIVKQEREETPGCETQLG
ncbi:uncharacterized protein LOC116958655 [Petromyzon marinus]|uniref:uncharacterized protein LOC116958655 n=1 Tax=Petromyzon marinus TaxID=7757 RepID=UPI003F727645